MNSLQFLTDASGVKTSVVIPINRLLHLSEIIDELVKLEQIANTIKTGIANARAIESGKIAGQSAESFLNEL